MSEEKRMKQAYADEKKMDQIKRNQSHTPGPWGWYQNFLVQARPDDSIPLNAKMIMKEAPEFFNDQDSRLISAAPDLLEACKSAARFIFELDKAYSNIRSSENPEGMKEPFKSLFEAIAKAEGK